MSQWEIARLEAEARLSRDSIFSSSSSSSNNKLMGNDNAEANSNAPTDIFLKLWNSESGKVFRKETIINNNNNSENPHGLDHDIGNALPWTNTSPQLTLSPVSSFCSGFNSDQLISNYPNGIIHKEVNSADWIGIAGYHDSSSTAIIENQTESKKPTHEDSSSSDELSHCHDVIYNHGMQDLTDLLLDSPNNKTSNNNSNIMCTMVELSTNSQQRSPWAWQELRLNEDNDYC